MTDNLPILFDGLHTTCYINHPSLANHKKFVRAHNIEHKYYRDLSKYETKIIRKLYFFVESLKLRLYEKKLGKGDMIFPIGFKDQVYFLSEYKRSELLLPFIPFNDLICNPGLGDYIIYHGNLWISENQAICEYLINEVFSRVPYKCIIAGKSPLKKLRMKASKYKNITIIPDPDEEQILRLIRDAHLNLLPALTCNGFKLKLLYALFAGRHCIANSMMLRDTKLDSLCHIADDSSSIIEKIHYLMGQPFTEEMISERSAILTGTYSNVKNAESLAFHIFRNEKSL